MAGGQLAARPVLPVLGDDLLLVGEPGRQAHHLVALRLAGGGAGAGRAGVGGEQVALAGGEGHDPAPLRGEELLDGRAAPPVGHRLGLPAVGVGQPVGAVDRPVAGVVGVGPAGRARLVAELVGAVVVAEVEDGPAGPQRHPGRGAVGRRLGGVVALPGQDGVEAGGQRREQVGQRQAGGPADGLLLGLESPLVGRPAQGAAEAGAHGDGVVGRPGVVHAGVGHGQRPGADRRRRPRGPDRLQHDPVPPQDGIGPGCATGGGSDPDGG